MKRIMCSICACVLSVAICGCAGSHSNDDIPDVFKGLDMEASSYSADSLMSVYDDSGAASLGDAVAYLGCNDAGVDVFVYESSGAYGIVFVVPVDGGSSYSVQSNVGVDFTDLIASYDKTSWNYSGVRYLGDNYVDSEIGNALWNMADGVSYSAVCALRSLDATNEQYAIVNDMQGLGVAHLVKNGDSWSVERVVSFSLDSFIS